MAGVGDKGPHGEAADTSSTLLAHEASEFADQCSPCWERRRRGGPGRGSAPGPASRGLAAGRLFVALAPAAVLLVLVVAFQPEATRRRVPAHQGGGGGADDPPDAPSASAPASFLEAFDGHDACDVSFADQDPRAECFCQVARNPGCSGRRCSCTVACPSDEASVRRHPNSVSFVGEKTAAGCSGKATSIVTVSKSYLTNLEDLKNTCPGRMTDLIAEMLRGGFQVYQQAVGPGAVRHCIKGDSTPGTPWLHVVTFCAEGEIDRMPSAGRFNWCATMTHESQAQWAATLATVWAGGQYSVPAPLPDSRPDVLPVAASGAGGLGSCREIGCGNHRPRPECSCNPACQQYGDCCSDYAATCEAASNAGEGSQCYFQYRDGGYNELCFCQLAGNPGCASEKCACDQGCGSDSLLGSGDHSVTFNNHHEAKGCLGPAVALLTIPKSFYRNIQSLKAKCSQGMVSLLASMLKSSFETYQTKVVQGAVSQCIHAAHSVSVGWLHIHTFCPGGGIDNLPGSSDVGWCGTMYTSSDAQPLAEAMVAWAHR